MSTAAFNPPSPQGLTLNGQPAKVGALTGRQTMRLAALAVRLNAELGLPPEGLKAMRPDVATILGLVRRAVDLAVGGIDLDKPETDIPPVAALVCRELGALCGVSGDDFIDATLDELTAVVTAYVEANDAGPLGRKLRSIGAQLRDLGSVMRDMMLVTSIRASTMDPPPGGMPDGGTTSSSSPSTESWDGESLTPSTASPSGGYSTSSEPSGTPSSSKATTPSATPAPEPMEAAEAAAAV